MAIQKIINKIGVVFLLSNVLTSILAFACGPTTHDEIAQRTVWQIDRVNYPDLFALVRDHPDERDIGSVFPDWGYAILNEEMSLVTHSNEFRQTYETYVRDHFPSPYLPAEKRQVAFLMGIVDHQTSDNHWHPYFLEEAIQQDNTSETVVEPVVDIFTIWEQGQLGHSDVWWVPIRTVLNVYYQMGYTDVTKAMVVEGMQVIHAGMFVEQNLTYLTYLLYRGLLPWTHANYMAYSPGGIQDDASASADENQITWDNIQGKEIAALRSSFVHDEKRSVIFEVGRELIRSGKIQVPVEYLEDGSVIIGIPEVVGDLEPNLFIPESD